VPRAEVADTTGGGVLAGGATDNPAQIRIRCHVDAPSSAHVRLAPAGAPLDCSGSANDGIARVAQFLADVGRGIPTGGGTKRAHVREASGACVDAAFVRADVSSAERIIRTGGLSAAGREPTADTLPPATGSVGHVFRALVPLGGFGQLAVGSGVPGDTCVVCACSPTTTDDCEGWYRSFSCR
jgi:hypothetical protein